MNKDIAPKALAFLVSATFLINSAYTNKVTASDVNFSHTPTEFVVLQNDLGKKLSVTITNTTNAEVTYTTTECLAVNNNGSLTKSDNVISKSVIDVDTPTLKIKANSTGTVDTRVRISATGGGTLIPCVIIKEKNVTNTGIEVLIPYYIQSFNGTLSTRIDLSIGNAGMVTNPDITISGSVTNTGEKFYTPKGTLTITKNGKKLVESDISSQLTGRLMPGATKSFEVKWINNLDTFSSLGEYQVEVRISNDQNSKVSIGQLVFNYTSNDLLIGGAVAGIALLAIIVGIVVLKKR